MKKILLAAILIFSLCLITAYAADDNSFELSNFYGDNMVLQANSKVVITGTAPKGSLISAKLSDGSKDYFAKGTADDENYFMLQFNKSFDYGYKKYTLSVSDGNDVIELNNIVFGDVYLLAGQSNMEYNMKDYYNSESDELQKIIQDEMSSYDNPDVRVIRAANAGNKTASNKIALSIRWRSINLESISKISAIGHYFSKEIQPYCDYPIGLLDFAWSGSSISPWLKGGDIYNTHIYPIRNLSIKGCLWYQGESDENEDSLYFDRQVELIETLREIFGKDLPFAMVQLANYSGTSRFQFIREQQYNVFKYYENLAKENKTTNKVGLVSIIDQVPVNISNVHPSGKIEVSARLALWTKSVIYGEKGEYSGPYPTSAKLKDEGIVITYNHTGSGLKTKNGESSVKSFVLYDKNGNKKATQGVINNDNTVTVNVNISNPVKIAYAYEPVNYGACLVNNENFAATPFAPVDIDISEYNPSFISNGAKLRAGGETELVISTASINSEDVEIKYEKPLEINRKNEDNAITLIVKVPQNCESDYYPVYFSYGNKSGFTFVQVYDDDEGDVNSDKKIDLTDFYLLCRYMAGYNVKINFNSADINADNIIDMQDVFALNKLMTR